jgi:hypothetical protein
MRKTLARLTAASAVFGGLTAALVLAAGGDASAESQAVPAQAAQVQMRALASVTRSWNNGLCLAVWDSVDPTLNKVAGFPCAVQDAVQGWGERPAPESDGGDGDRAWHWATPEMYSNWADAQGPVQIVSAANQWCLDSNEAGDVYVKPCEAGNAHQTWAVHTYQANEAEPSKGVFVYVNYATDRALQINRDGSVRTEPIDFANHSNLEDFNHAL